MPLIRWASADVVPKHTPSAPVAASSSSGALVERRGLSPSQTQFVEDVLRRGGALLEEARQPPPADLGLKSDEHARLDASAAAARRRRRPAAGDRVDVDAHAFGTFFSGDRLARMMQPHGRDVEFRRAQLRADWSALHQAADALKDEPLSGHFHPAARQVERLAQTFLQHAASHRARDGQDADRLDVATSQVKSMLVLVRQSMQQHLDAALRDQVAAQPSLRAEARQQHALMLSQRFGAVAAPGGSSDVELIRNADRRIAYAFKPVAGESNQTLIPPGGGAMREALCAAAGREVLRQTGLDLGFPEVTLAVMSGHVGALVDGLPGECLDPEALMARVDRESISPQTHLELKVRGDEVATCLAPVELQKVLLANLLTGNLDVKWGNVMVDPAGRCRPFDGGTAFPTAAQMAMSVALGVQPSAMGYLPFSVSPAAASVEMNRGLVEAVLRIDPQAYAAALQDARSDLLKSMDGLARRDRSGTSIDTPRLLTEADVQRGVASLRLVQDVLRSAPRMTMNAFARQFSQRAATLTSATELEALQRLQKADPRLARKDRAAFVARFEQACAATQPVRLSERPTEIRG
ncbi:hypothetical protein [Roseateles amylovorans]|uniref:Uncharacterized protein n=1 Tax=Roseateles amylovorans TaxID=2978473 RepID=A0ABY6B860_9BURK|nr:hypothetical protein [Roseateles amylovorans]UXH80558.1 hypothetical protein N4261_12075 [Roseateles amylovorans]